VWIYEPNFNQKVSRILVGRKEEIKLTYLTLI
jgi:hypothetical protein